MSFFHNFNFCSKNTFFTKRVLQLKYPPQYDDDWSCHSSLFHQLPKLPGQCPLLYLNFTPYRNYSADSNVCMSCAAVTNDCIMLLPTKPDGVCCTCKLPMYLDHLQFKPCYLSSCRTGPSALVNMHPSRDVSVLAQKLKRLPNILQNT